MDKQRIILIVASVAVVILVGVLIFVLPKGDGTPAQPPATGQPLISDEDVIAPSDDPLATPSAPAPEDTATPVAPGQHGDTCEEQGPVTCEENPVFSNPEDMELGAQMIPAVEAFARAWAVVSTAEGTDGRAERLGALGASDEVAHQVSLVTREHTGIVGLSVDASPERDMLSLFIERDGDLLKFNVTMNINAYYTDVNGDKDSFFRIGGTLELWLTETGQVQRVVEDFPSVA